MSKGLLAKAISYTKSITNIIENEVGIVMQARKPLLLHENKPWVKTTGREDFDVRMWCFYRAKICELVGSLILSRLSDVFENKNAGLYKYQGLGVTKQMSNPELDSNRKRIIEIFKKYRLSTTIKMSLYVVNLLDLQFGLKSNLFRLYKKANNDPINIPSNHPPQILNALQKMLEEDYLQYLHRKNYFKVQ